MIEVLRADLATLDVDAIVNAATSGLRGAAALLSRTYERVFGRG